MGVQWWNLQSQLLVAIQKDDAAKAKELLADGVDVDARFIVSGGRRPALCLCVERDSLDLVRLMLDFGCSVNQSDMRGQTALHLAASRGHVELLKLLLKNKASVKSLDEQKRTALHWAAQRDNVEMAQLLIEHGSAIDPLDQDGRTPLLLACQMNLSSSAVALLLLRRGADATVTDQQGNTALHLAVSAVDPQLVAALVSSGPKSVNSVNQAGLTPLHIALQQQQQQQVHRTEIIKILVDAGCELDLPTPLGQTALHLAVQERDESSCLLFLRFSARPDTVDRLGLPPLFHAARDGNKLLVQALLAAGAHRTLRDSNSWIQQPHFMAEIRDTAIIQLILSAAAICPRLTWLARTAFRSYAKEHSSSLTSRLNYPPSLIQFINFADVYQDWN